MQLTFLGAARQVTGSMALLTLADGYRLLIDCGLELERKPHERGGLNELFDFNPAQIDVVLLTHAHLDHSGNIPNLYKKGYKGQVLCTAPTAALSEILLYDSASLNRKRLNEARGKKQKRKGEQSETANLYLEHQVSDALEGFVTISFNKLFEVREGLRVMFIPTGHLLGAANIYVEIDEDGQTKKILFSGDIGRHNYPLLVDPQPSPQVDYLICETTYGRRNHQSGKDAEAQLEKIIRETCIDITGRLIIPAFSVGRTQALMFTLNKLYIQGRLPHIKVFSDSPLAFKSTEVYNKFNSYLNTESISFLKQNHTLFDFENMHYIERLKESKSISNYQEPCIIISSSGMIEGGRIQHHVKANLSNPYATILMIGYSSEGTLGHRLMHGDKTIRMGKKEMTVLARVRYTDVFSGHGDHDDLLNFVKNQSTESLKQVFLVHGEYESMLSFREDLLQEGYKKVDAPQKGSVYEL